MFNYGMEEWIAFFAVYCFIGWMFESVYVSIEYRKPVNRGFLYGPVLPIYGFGAIIILLVSLPFNESVLLTFFSGMLGATAIEYVTGYTIEKVFGVRYWDYTYEPLNLNGYICLGCSLMWGLFSVVLTEYLHKNVVSMINHLNDKVLVMLDICFIFFLVIDIYASVKAAFDIKEMLREYVENNEYIRKMQKRMDILYAFAENDYNNLQTEISKRKEEYEEERERVRDSLVKAREKFGDKRTKSQTRAMYVLKRNPSMTSIHHRFEINNLKGIFNKKSRYVHKGKD